MKKHSSSMTYIGLMTALYGLLLMGAVYAGSSIGTASPIITLNEFYEALVQSLEGVSSLLVFLGALFLLAAFFLRGKE